jgi:hypothetical protein
MTGYELHMLEEAEAGAHGVCHTPVSSFPGSVCFGMRSFQFHDDDNCGPSRHAPTPVPPLLCPFFPHPLTPLTSTTSNSKSGGSVNAAPGAGGRTGREGYEGGEVRPKDGRRGEVQPGPYAITRWKSSLCTCEVG